jgi:hypothetical protein
VRLYLAIACFALAALAFLNGFVTEYRQSRRVGPYAIEPTLPWAVAAAIFVVLGLGLIPGGVPWWAFPVAFVAAVVAFGFGIYRAGARPGPDGE